MEQLIAGQKKLMITTVVLIFEIFMSRFSVYIPIAIAYHYVLGYISLTKIDWDLDMDDLSHHLLDTFVSPDFNDKWINHRWSYEFMSDISAVFCGFTYWSVT